MNRWNLNYNDEPDTEVGNLRAALIILLNQHEQYADYSERMRHIGKGFDPSCSFTPEYAQRTALKALGRI
jgi:hypothetical protein